MKAQLPERRRRRGGSPTSGNTTAATPKKKRSKSKSTRPSRRSPKDRPPLSTVATTAKPDGYLYLELITADLHAVSDIERELKIKTSLAERCYTHSRIPIYRIPESEQEKFKVWPYILGQTKYAGRCLPANNKAKETYVFLGLFDHAYMLNGTFKPLTEQKSAGKARKRQRRSKISA